MTGASFNRENSKQDYETPKEFIAAVERQFGKLTFDLAASSTNHKADRWFDEQTNGLAQDWSVLSGNLWLNPPFGDIEPWAKKCAETESQTGARIFLLVPASVGSVWFARYVHTHAEVRFLRPRLSFDGKNPYPKDCILAIYGLASSGYDTWDWKNEARTTE